MLDHRKSKYFETSEIGFLYTFLERGFAVFGVFSADDIEEKRVKLINPSLEIRTFAGHLVQVDDEFSKIEIRTLDTCTGYLGIQGVAGLLVLSSDRYHHDRLSQIHRFANGLKSGRADECSAGCHHFEKLCIVYLSESEIWRGLVTIGNGFLVPECHDM